MNFHSSPDHSSGTSLFLTRNGRRSWWRPGRKCQKPSFLVVDGKTFNRWRWLCGDDYNPLYSLTTVPIQKCLLPSFPAGREILLLRWSLVVSSCLMEKCVQLWTWRQTGLPLWLTKWARSFHFSDLIHISTVDYWAHKFRRVLRCGAAAAKEKLLAGIPLWTCDARFQASLMWFRWILVGALSQNLKGL